MANGSLNNGGFSSEIKEDFVPIEEMLQLLDIEGDEKVIDLGSENGFFTIPIAKATNDRVVVVGLDQEMLERLDEKADREGLTNVDRMPSGIDSLNFPDHSFQRGLAAFVLPEVSNVRKTLAEISRVIAEKGKLVVLEWERKIDEGAFLDEKHSKDGLYGEMEQAGFHVESGQLNEHIHFLIGTN